MYQLFYNLPMSSPTGLYFGLIGVPPTNVLERGNYGEVGVGSNYIRVPAGNVNGTGLGVWSYYLYGSGAVYNNQQVTWPTTANPNGDWGWASGIAIFDNAQISSGNMVFYGTLTTPQELSLNSQFYIPVSGALVRMS
jgi:hypothetical protein